MKLPVHHRNDIELINPNEGFVEDRIKALARFLYTYAPGWACQAVVGSHYFASDLPEKLREEIIKLYESDVEDSPKDQ